MRAVRRLDLAKVVEVAHVRRHRLDVRDDDVAGDELDAPADEGSQRAETGGGARSAVTVAAQALDRRDRSLVVGEEALGPRDRRRPRQLDEHLAGPRGRDVDVVEERLDRRVVAREQLEPLEGIDVVLVSDAASVRRASEREPNRGCGGSLSVAV